MKTLYLHCGIHKTGSSFLQTMFTRNRTLLRDNDIHYPKSEKELEMLQGEISPGNGVHLARTLLNKESDTLELLKNDLELAKDLNLHSVLYSSENLFHNFAQNDSVEKLYRVAKLAGFDKIKALVYFRDPVAHVLSTYKHRAKNGDHSDFKKWVESGYETYSLIDSFLHYNETYQISWSCRKYSPDSLKMIKSSFIDWLGIDAPNIPDDDRVNRSLLLGEIQILQMLKKEYPGSESFLREALLSVPEQEKVDDKSLKSEFQRQSAELLSEHEILIKSLNNFMKQDEKLSIEFEPLEKKIKNENGFFLSKAQIKAVALGMEYFVDSKKPLYKVKDFCKRGINKMKRKWLASKLSYSLSKRVSRS